MSTGIVVAIVLFAVVGVAGAVAVHRSRALFQRAAEAGPPADSEHAARTAAVRLTGSTLQRLHGPVWKVVHEITDRRLSGADHVLIGPPGAFAVVTTLGPLPAPTDEEPDPAAVAAAAITRGGLDDALARVRLGACRLLTVHWGITGDAGPAAVPGVHGVVHVDGRHLADWAAGLPEGVYTPSQVELAWQAVALAIGRPDPLA